MNPAEFLSALDSFFNSAFGFAVTWTALVAVFFWLASRFNPFQEKWREWEGSIITAIKLAEKEIPDDTPSAGLARLDAALRFVLKAYAIDNAGMIVGWSEKYDEFGNHLGNRAVRWDASGQATELAHLGLRSDGYTNAQAVALNNTGMIVGWSEKYDEHGNHLGKSMVRWDAAGAEVVELSYPGVDFYGSTYAAVHAINDAGMVVGWSEVYDGTNDWSPEQAVRWDISGQAMLLERIGNSEWAYSAAFDINASGTAVGYSEVYDEQGSHRGERAVRWDVSGQATELTHLGLDSNGAASARAHAVNDAGTAVGYASKITSTSWGFHAVIWLPDASVIDLNDLGLVDATEDGTWQLISAHALSRDGWVAGIGQFTPNGGVAYRRLFVTQVGLGGEWTDAFTGSLDGVWGRGDQWTTGTPAMQVGDAIFNIDAAYTVALDRDEQTRTLTLTRGTVMLAFNGHTLETLSGLTIAGGTLKGSGTILGNVIQTGGTLAAGHSPGAMTIDGDYLLDAGTLQIELAGSGGVAGIDFDFYDITGTATLSGVLELIGWDGFTPTAGQTFSVLTASSIDTTGLTLAGLDGFTYSILAGGSGQVLQLQAVPEPATGLLALGGAFVLLRRRR